jgi:GT2 family glycosyltransferase
MEKHAAVLDPDEGQIAAPADPLARAPDVTVVTVSTNEADVLDICLSSVLENKVDMECIVVNNASTDRTDELLASKYRDNRVMVVNNSARRSLAENCNIGLRKARGRYVLLLNPDTRLLPDTLETMVQFMDAHVDSAVATCRLLNRDGSSQDHIRRFPTPWRVLIRLLGMDKLFPNYRAVREYLMRDMDRTKTQEVEWFILAFFFVRKSAAEKIGFLDEKFLRPYYCEDTEWCYRARLHGYRNYCVAETATFHDYQQGSRKKIGRLTFIHIANNLLLYQKLAVLRLRKGLSLRTGRVEPQ